MSLVLRAGTGGGQEFVIVTPILHLMTGGGGLGRLSDAPSRSRALPLPEMSR